MNCYAKNNIGGKSFYTSSIYRDGNTVRNNKNNWLKNSVWCNQTFDYCHLEEEELDDFEDDNEGDDSDKNHNKSLYSNLIHQAIVNETTYCSNLMIKRYHDFPEKLLSNKQILKYGLERWNGYIEKESSISGSLRFISNESGNDNLEEIFPRKLAERLVSQQKFEEVHEYSFGFKSQENLGENFENVDEKPCGEEPVEKRQLDRSNDDDYVEYADHFNNDLQMKME